MKVLRTIESFYPFVTGPANQAYKISKELERNRIESPIFTTNYKAKDTPKEEKIDWVNVKRFGYKFSFMKFLYTPKMKKAIMNENPQIIHAHNYRSYQSEIGIKCAKKLGIPFVINTHGSLLGYESITKGVNKLPYKAFDLLGRAVKDASAVIVSSQQEYDEALKYGVDSDKLHVIPMGIDVEEYDKIKRDRKDKKLRLLFVGRICRDRNIMPVLEALKKLDDEDIELRIVGGAVKRSDTEKGGYLEELKKYAEENNLNVTFTGPLYGEELKKEYKNGDVFVYTSLWENFGQALLEAGASGLPIIATPVGIAENIITNGKIGYIVDFEDELDKKIQLLKDKKKREKFGRALREIIEENYKWEDIIMEYEKVYLKVKKT